MSDKSLTRDEVIAAIEFMLGRPPADEAEITRLLGLGTRGQLRYFLAGSEEYSLDPAVRRAYEIAQFRRLRATPLPIEIAGTRDQIDRLFRLTQDAWERLGREEPYWSVVTSEAFRAGRIGDTTREAFYASGADEVDVFLRFLHRAGIQPGSLTHLLEVGCGLGRMTEHFARHFPKVTAVDISEPHLRVARSRMDTLGASHVRFEKVRGPADYLTIGGYDVAVSFIVLQHSPPPIIHSLLAALFANLRSGGVTYFQVPTFIEGYSFGFEAYMQATKGEMEMHCIPQAVVFDLMREHGIRPLEVINDGSGGDYRFESCRFLGRKA